MASMANQYKAKKQKTTFTPAVVGTLQEVAAAVSDEAAATFTVSATVVSVEQSNGAYVQKKKIDDQLFFAAKLILKGGDEFELELKALGDFIGRILGLSADEFQAAEEADDAAQLEAAFGQVDTETSFTFIIKVSYSTFAEKFEATILKMS
jgi:hypothetical protein